MTIKIIQVKTTEEQNQKIRDYAHKVGLPPSSFIRFLVLKKIQEETSKE